MGNQFFCFETSKKRKDEGRERERERERENHLPDFEIERTVDSVFLSAEDSGQVLSHGGLLITWISITSLRKDCLKEKERKGKGKKIQKQTERKKKIEEPSSDLVLPRLSLSLFCRSQLRRFSLSSSLSLLLLLFFFRFFFFFFFSQKHWKLKINEDLRFSCS